MQLGMIGLGRMGANMSRRLMQAGHQIVGFDRNAGNVGSLAGADEAKTAAGAFTGAGSMEELVQKLQPPRAIWLMVPAGPPTEQAVVALAGLLAGGDTVIDGGNTFFKDDVRRAGMLQEKNLHYVDCGTSGGIWGLERGYCLMIGGPEEAVKRLEPIFQTLAPGQGGIPPSEGRKPGASTAENGYLHCGPAGSGHFVKMVHNGIEYGLMQAYAEGFDILRGAKGVELTAGAANTSYDLPLADIAELWRRGSVVSSWLLDLTASALAQDPKLSAFSGYVEDSGEGRWTIQAAIEAGVPAEVLSTALFTRFRSRQEHTFAEKMLSAMRRGFGGHIEQRPPEQKVDKGL